MCIHIQSHAPPTPPWHIYHGCQHHDQVLNIWTWSGTTSCEQTQAALTASLFSRTSSPMSMISSESSSGGVFCKPPTSLFQIPSLCVEYHLFVSNTISLFQYHLFVSIPSLCFKNHLFVSGTTSLFQIPSLCFEYHLFVSNTISLF